MTIQIDRPLVLVGIDVLYRDVNGSGKRDVKYFSKKDLPEMEAFRAKMIAARFEVNILGVWEQF